MFFSTKYEDVPDNCVRVAVMGAAECGKTSLLSQYLHYGFSDRYCMTTGLIHKKEIELGERKIQFHIWDTPGGCCFEAARQQAIGICDAFLLVYAVHSLESFRRVQDLYEEIRAQRGADIPVVVAATMVDLPVRQWFEHPQLMKSVVDDEMGCKLFEVTARKWDGISQVFCEIGRQVRKSTVYDDRKTTFFTILNSVKGLFKRKV